MFGISSLEFLVVLLVAIVVVGPEKMPRIMRTVAKMFSEFRKVKTDFQRIMNLELANMDLEKAKKIFPPLVSEPITGNAQHNPNVEPDAVPPDVAPAETSPPEPVLPEANPQELVLPETNPQELVLPETNPTDAVPVSEQQESQSSLPNTDTTQSEQAAQAAIAPSSTPPLALSADKEGQA
ncbi:MAG: twin-arginine translocase TatA/TatE family subunit [Deltaproteobacteria bacterium]|jgi:sec-independent protein translocase protein TatB|nr:twin-arginine translocase TatA/TatE family subunit [Deltaproteobacteria bacterium]